MAGLRGYVFVVLCGALMAGWLLHRILSGRLRAEYALFWGAFGALAMVFAVWPGLIDILAAQAGIAYAPSLLIVFVGVFSFGYLVHLSEKVSDQRAQIQTLSQEIALLKARDEAEAAVAPAEDG